MSEDKDTSENKEVEEFKPLTMDQEALDAFDVSLFEDTAKEDAASDSEAYKKAITDDTEGKKDTVAEEEDVKDEDVSEKDDVLEDTTEESSSSDSKEDSEKDEEVSDKIDYEAEYKKLTQPFTANSKQISVNSVDDAIILMQKGAGYEKNNAAMNANKALLKMLDNNGLLSEEKINELIDLSNKNPAAIKKLVKDSELDGFDLSEETEDTYVPTDHSVSTKDIEFDNIINEIKDTKSFDRVVDVVTKEWDQSSKTEIYNDPTIMTLLNSHMESGVYDQINNVIESERMYGRLSKNSGSDIETYLKVGDAIQAKNGFDHLFKKANDNAPAIKKVAKKTDNSDKRNASLNRSSSASKSVSNFNPLTMSNEELDKVDTSKW